MTSLKNSIKDLQEYIQKLQEKIIMLENKIITLETNNPSTGQVFMHSIRVSGPSTDSLSLDESSARTT